MLTTDNQTHSIPNKGTQEKFEKSKKSKRPSSFSSFIYYYFRLQVVTPVQCLGGASGIITVNLGSRHPGQSSDPLCKYNIITLHYHTDCLFFITNSFIFTLSFHQSQVLL